MRRSILPISALAALAACSTVSAQDEEYPVREAQGQCDASDVQELIGHKATQELGATLLTRTGARVLRWVAPGTAVTMDYRADRLTVSYDENMMIERISCG